MAPLVEEMLQRIGGEVGRYERVIAYWHVFGPLLEGAVCASLRETTGAVTRQCGLSQVRFHVTFINKLACLYYACSNMVPNVEVICYTQSRGTHHCLGDHEGW